MGRTYTRLTEAQKKKVFQMVEDGVTRKEIANKFHCSQGTVLRAYKQILTKQEELEKKRTDTDRIVEIIGLHELKHNTVDGYLGCFYHSGGYDTKIFKTAKDDKKAIEMFKRWIEEREFHYVALDIPPEPSKPETAPTTKEIELACEAIIIGDEPVKTDIYVILATVPKINAYGYFCSMERALAEVDKLNAVAKLLGHGEVFDILEVSLKEGM